MRTVLSAICYAFSTYSVVPMPAEKADGNAYRYTLCAFPLVGLFVGGVFIIWNKLAANCGMDRFLTAAVSAALPALLTGGIHMDGFMDTVDALHSYRGREKSLEIMKDPHTGAMAVIYTVLFYMIYFASMAGLDHTGYIAVGIGFVLSRCASGAGILFGKPARENGMAKSLTDGGGTGACRAFITAFAAFGVAGEIFFAGIRGAVLSGVMVLLTLWYMGMTERKFGGVTGDTSGYLSSLCELSAAVVCVFMKGL